VIWLIAALQLEQLPRLPRRRVAALGVVLFVASIGIGGWVNTWLGTRYLYRDYAHRVLPALELVLDRDERFVAVEHQWIAQELAAAFGAKRFFRARDEEQLMQLARRMHAEGESRFLWLRFDPGIARVRREAEITRRCENLGRHGSYFVFGCRIGSSGAAQDG